MQLHFWGIHTVWGLDLERAVHRVKSAQTSWILIRVTVIVSRDVGGDIFEIIAATA
jgi:hypothetical protein